MQYTDFVENKSFSVYIKYCDTPLFFTSLYVRQHAQYTQFKNADSWVILSDIEQRIKAKIEAIGTPLKDWDINIYRGILTGYNEAFIIDKVKKEEILSNCKTEEERQRTVEIIRPILRGRDIKKYGYEFADLYLLFIPWHFPFHLLKPEIKGASQEAEEAFKNQYPAIYNHLLQYKTELSNRNKSETGIRYEWYALQRWGANYWEDFSKQKIIWKIIGNELAFCIENGNFMINNACYLLTGNHLEYIVAFLNSKPIKWFSLQTNMNKTGVGDMQVGAQNISLFPIPIPKAQYEQEIVNLLKISDYQKVEKLINEIYQLSEEEIIFIEKL